MFGKCLIGLMLGACAAPAGAYYIAWEGDCLPEDAGWERNWGDWTGQYHGTGAIRTIADGVMTMDSLYDPGVYDFAALHRSFNPAPGEQFVMEWRLAVDQVTGDTTPAYDPAVALFSDDSWGVAFEYSQDSLRNPFEAGMSVAITAGEFHDYRLTSWDMRTYQLFIDGSLAHQGSFWQTVGPHEMNWGDGVQGAASLHRWDYVRVYTVPGTPPPTCEWTPWEEGVSGEEVVAMTTWDPDGPGPLPELLIVGGSFPAAGPVESSNVAAWDGSSWQSLGGGTDGEVEALAVYNGELIAGGWFTTAGGVACSHIAAWDGSTWHPLGSGTSGVVSALAVYNGELVVGGAFWHAGGLLLFNLARWNGSVWQPLGPGLNGIVCALTVYNGELIAAGEFRPTPTSRGVALWDGSTWQALGTGVSSAALALATYGGQLIVGGGFASAGGVMCWGIASWDGDQWQTLGPGLDGAVRSLTTYGGALIVGGDFGFAGPVPCHRIGRWDGAEWLPLGAGVDPGEVDALAVYNDQLIAGGTFQTVGEGAASRQIGTWSCNYDRGDLNCDAAVNVFDIDPFVLALTDAVAYAAAFPYCEQLLADINGDGAVDVFDIDPFVLLLTGGD